MKKKIVTAIIIIFMVALFAFYIWDIVYNKTPITKNLFRVLAIEFLLAGTVVRMFNSVGRVSLKIYEKQFEKHIGNAFSDSKLRLKLLCAIRLFDESNYNKALKYLAQLRDASKTTDDFKAVHLFAALCFDYMGINDLAVQEYRELIKIDPDNNTAYSNLGIVYERYGDYKNAKINYFKALELKPDSQIAYNNIAQCYFKERNFDSAIMYAEKALEIDNNLLPTLKLLAMIYHITNDIEKRELYFHKSIVNGENPEELKEILEYFKVEFENEDSEEF